MTAPAPHPNDDLPVKPGNVLAGKYRVERILGKGGMGVVVEARHVALDERVALKFLLPDYAQVPEASARFLREARAAVKIKSEHVARVSDVGTLESGAPYMVMEFLEGVDLSNALERYGVCQIPDAIDYLLQTCEAIQEAHGHGIVHRDLKPANLFLTRRPDGTPMVKVLDFGISKMSGSGVDNLTRTTTSMGSALYMSPEQMQTTRGVDHRTDIYALGISLYELLAGKQPFYADTLPQLCAEVLTGTPTPIRQLRADVPEGLAAALEKAYARERDQRYQTIAEFAAGIAPWAPTKSQNTLDRIARMAGVAPAVAGSAPRAMSQSQPNLGPSLSGGTFYMGEPSAAQTGNHAIGQTGNHPGAQTGNRPGAQTGGAFQGQTGNHPGAQTGGAFQGQPVAAAQTGNLGAQTGNLGSQTGNLGAQTGNFGAQTGNSALQSPAAQAVAQTGANYAPHIDSLAIGGYHGPMSTKAAAAFASGTNANLSSTQGVGASSGGKTGLFVVIGVLAVALLGLGGAFLALRGGAATSGSAASPGGDSTSSAVPAVTTSAPATTAAPTADASGAPATTATPTAATTAEPAPTSSATASPSGAPSTKPKTPVAKPVGSTKKPTQMTSR